MTTDIMADPVKHERKLERRRRYRQQIKADPVLYERQLQRDRDRHTEKRAVVEAVCEFLGMPMVKGKAQHRAVYSVARELGFTDKD